MNSDSVRSKRFIALFLLGYILLGNPILSLFNLPHIIWGIPLLFFYIFGIWIVLIVLVALIISSKAGSH